jgi:hypothetical protein
MTFCPGHSERRPQRRRLLRAVLGIAVMVLACCGGMRTRVAEMAETPVEILELRHDFETGARMVHSRHRLQRGHHGEVVVPQSREDHAASGLAAVIPAAAGHRLANGLRAPLRC